MVSEVNCLQQILSRIILKYEIKEIGSLSDDVLLELAVMPDYDTKQEDFKFLVDTLKSLYQSKNSEISPYIDLFKIRQQSHETVKDFYPQFVFMAVEY